MKHSALAWVMGTIGTIGFAVACGSTSGGSGFNINQNDNADGSTSNNGADGSSSCGFGCSANPDAGSLVLNPSNAIVYIDTATTPATPGTQAFTVANNGTDVTAGSTFTIDDTTLGTFNGATFTAVASLPAGVLGKSGTVTAVTPDGTAQGALTVVALRRTGSDRDFFFVEPFNGTPTPPNDVLAFSTNIQNVDVAFVMDTTGSMGGEISALKSALSGTLLTQLQTAIPSVGMAIISQKDVADGSGINGVCGIASPITTTLATAQAAIATLSAEGGGDEPEAQVGCMDYVLTGKALVCASSDNGACSSGTTLETAVAKSAAGNFGAAQFRPGAVPVVVEITDANWHDPSAGITAAQLATDFNAANARFISLAGDNYGGTTPAYEVQANTLSDATNSNLPPAALGWSAGQCLTGMGGAARGPIGGTGADAANCRLNFQFDYTSGTLGPTFTNSIAQAIKGIATGSQFNVTTKPVNDPANAGGVDATKFIKTLRAMDEGDPANNCPAHPAIDTDGDGILDTFTAVVVGTPVCFQIIPAVNTFVAPTSQPQFFDANINVLGMPGSVQLDQRKVTFLVPPAGPNVN